MRIAHTSLVTIPVGSYVLEGELTVPQGSVAAVVFAHGSGSSRHSPRNRFVAERLQAAGIATLLTDLLTEDEASDRRMVFDIPLLADRVAQAASRLRSEPATARLPIGLFGASTGGGAALVAAARYPESFYAVVSRGGRPDLADEALPLVKCPTLLIVGSEDTEVLTLNQAAQNRMIAECELAVVPGATHLFEEPGTLDQAADLAAEWFVAKVPEAT
jgi:pimeloyl-ACP methyl ester carboxylesterase